MRSTRDSTSVEPYSIGFEHSDKYASKLDISRVLGTVAIAIEFFKGPNVQNSPYRAAFRAGSVQCRLVQPKVHLVSIGESQELSKIHLPRIQLKWLAEFVEIQRHQHQDAVKVGEVALSRHRAQLPTLMRPDAEGALSAVVEIIDKKARPSH